MSFRPRTDANPNIIIQRTQSGHLKTSNSLLPNTSKDGTGQYLSPLLNTDGHLIVDSNGSNSNIVHGTSLTNLINNVSYATGTHISNVSDTSTSTGLMSLHGTISGADVNQSITVQGGTTLNGTYFDLNDIHINLVIESSSLTFASNFETAFPYIRLKYINGDVISRTITANLIFKT